MDDAVALLLDEMPEDCIFLARAPRLIEFARCPFDLRVRCPIYLMQDVAHGTKQDDSESPVQAPFSFVTLMLQSHPNEFGIAKH